MEGITDRALLLVREAADFLSVSRWAIYRWVEEGRLRGTKIWWGSLRIFHESIAGLVRNKQVAILCVVMNNVLRRRGSELLAQYKRIMDHELNLSSRMCRLACCVL
ncbi:MAG: excisionase family DNA-binding protein [Nitrospirota bacterium]|nr:excisionase family DNA-binding protein [Nitrospirota bacterium]MDP3596092.1 excisionase family DNA-binding protein [Nitrospirota bacterium]